MRKGDTAKEAKKNNTVDCESSNPGVAYSVKVIL